MAIVNLLPLSSVPAGTLPFAEQAVHDGATSIRLTMQRDNWQDTGANVITASFEISIDGGATWSFFSGFTTAGGNIYDANNVLQTETYVIFALPAAINRKLRGQMQFAVGLSTKIDVEAT